MLGVRAEVDDCGNFVGLLEEGLVVWCCEVWSCAAVEEAGFEEGGGGRDISEIGDFGEGI